MAIEGGSIDEVELLLNCGANPNKARDDGETPISFAQETNKLEILQLLLEKAQTEPKIQKQCKVLSCLP